MSDQGAVHLVLRDDAGSYYLLPEALLQSTRVPDDRVAAVEAALQGGGDEVGGYMLGGSQLNPPPGLTGQSLQIPSLQQNIMQNRFSQVGIIIYGHESNRSG